MACRQTHSHCVLTVRSVLTEGGGRDGEGKGREKTLVFLLLLIKAVSPSWGLLAASAGKESAYNTGDSWVGKIPEKGYGCPLQYSCLKNPMDRGAWQVTQSVVLQRVTTE